MAQPVNFEYSILSTSKLAKSSPFDELFEEMQSIWNSYQQNVKELKVKEIEWRVLLKLDLRNNNHRKLAMQRIITEWTDSWFNAKITDQIDNDIVFDIVRYELLIQDTYLYDTLSSIYSKLLKLTANDDLYQIVLGHWMQVSSMIFTDKLLLKYLFRNKPKSAKLFLSICLYTILDKFNKTKVEHLRTFINVLIQSAMYWKKDDFQHLIDNDLCQLIKKYVTKLKRGTRVELLMAGIDPGHQLRNYVNNLFLIIRFHAHKDGVILKRYKSELQKVFLNKTHNHIFKYLIFANAALQQYYGKKIMNKSLLSLYKDGRISFCAWIVCKKTDEDGKDDKLFKCRGCKLTLYCSRNHQKKHWKFIHYQQCLRNN